MLSVVKTYMYLPHTSILQGHHVMGLNREDRCAYCTTNLSSSDDGAAGSWLEGFSRFGGSFEGQAARVTTTANTRILYRPPNAAYSGDIDMCGSTKLRRCNKARGNQHSDFSVAQVINARRVAGGRVVFLPLRVVYPSKIAHNQVQHAGLPVKRRILSTTLHHEWRRWCVKRKTLLYGPSFRASTIARTH